MPDLETFEVLEYEKKPPARNGKKWCRVRLKPGGWASCWEDDSVREMLYKAEGTGQLFTGTFDITDEDKGYKNVENVKPAAAGASTGGGGLRGFEKDVSIVRQTAWKATGFIMQGSLGGFRNDDSTFDVDGMLETAGKIARYIEADILSPEPPADDDFQPAEVAPDDDIPF